MAVLEEQGVRVRRPLALRSQLVRYDDLDRVEGDTAVTLEGFRFRVARQDAMRLATILAGPPVSGTLEAVGSGFAAHLSGFHGPRRAARALLDAAASLRASDVHLEPAPGETVVRVRLAGELVELCRLAPVPAHSLVAAVKGLAGCLPYRNDVVQEGQVQRSGVGADVRASFVPTALGERVALRLFGRLLSLEELGLEPQLLLGLKRALSARTGLLVVAGGTGSGKTTTLYAALAEVAASRRGAHLSLEDPVEQRLRVAGIPVDQVELSPERGLTAEAMLVAALRQDVDVLSVGEIRTASEAALAVRASHTGRLVLAGLHAGSAAEARQRLLDLCVEKALLDSTLRAVLYQELVGGPCGCEAAERCPRCQGVGRVRRLSAELSLLCTLPVLRGVA